MKRYINGKLVDLSPAEVAERQAEEAAAPAAALAVWRASVALPVDEFADAIVAAGLITEAEADSWVMRNALPPAAQAAIDAEPDARSKRKARYKMLAAVTVARSHPLVAVLAQSKNLTPEAVDALFKASP